VNLCARGLGARVRESAGTRHTGLFDSVRDGFARRVIFVFMFQASGRSFLVVLKLGKVGAWCRDLLDRRASAAFQNDLAARSEVSPDVLARRAENARAGFCRWGRSSTLSRAARLRAAVWIRAENSDIIWFFGLFGVHPERWLFRIIRIRGTRVLWVAYARCSLSRVEVLLRRKSSLFVEVIFGIGGRWWAADEYRCCFGGGARASGRS